MANIIDVNGLPYMRVGDITVGTATTSVSFTGLDIGKDDDYLLVSDLVNASASGIDCYLVSNANSTLTNYWSQIITADSIVVNSARGNVPYLVSCGGSLKSIALTNVKLTNSGYACWQSSIDQHVGSSTIILRKYHGTSTFTSASITSLTITSSVASAIGIGSRFQLYKLVAEKVADIIVATATTSVDITGLNIDKNSEYMLVSDLNNTTASDSGYPFCVNNNVTSTNYSKQDIYGDSTSVVGARSNANMTIWTTASTKAFVMTNIKLTNSGYVILQQNSNIRYGASNMFLLNSCVTSTFTATSITSLKITASVANAIGIGSRFTLYKIR